MGKWFDGFREKGKKEALEFGKKKELSVMEILEVPGNYRRYFVGEQLPKTIQKDVGTKVHVLVLWRPGGGEDAYPA